MRTKNHVTSNRSRRSRLAAAALAACLIGIGASAANAGVIQNFQQRVIGGQFQYLGVPLNSPNTVAEITLMPGDPNATPVSTLTSVAPGGERGWFSWRKIVKATAVVVGGVAGGLTAAAAAAPATGGLGSVPAAIWGAGAGGGAAATAAATLLANLPEEEGGKKAADADIHKSINVRSAQGAMTDITAAFVTKLASATAPAITFPGGATFTPSTAVSANILDAAGIPVPGAQAAWGVLRFGSSEFPMSISDFDWSTGNRGIRPTDYLDTDMSWALQQYPSLTSGNLVLGTSAFFQTVPTPGSTVTMLLGAALAFPRRRRQR